MKKIGAVQMVSLVYRPSVYVFDEIKHKLIFNRILTPEDIKRVIAEFGKEISMLKNVRAVANSLGTLKSQRELDIVVALEQDLIELYNNADHLAELVKNGSGLLELRNTTLKFTKPRVVEFPDD